MFSKFLYTNPHSISKQLCDEIIHLYEFETKYEGVTGGGLNKNVKDTSDFIIQNNEKWSKIYEFLGNELQLNIKTYFDRLNENEMYNENTNTKHKFFNNAEVIIKTFMIQRYIKQVGRYIYHHDSSIEWNESQYRIVTFLWYLNTVNEGGETEVLGEHKIKPEAGKLLLFPACWTFPHTGKIPISDNKYIITGWIYLNKDGY